MTLMLVKIERILSILLSNIIRDCIILIFIFLEIVSQMKENT